jgi:IS30 family transposase
MKEYSALFFVNLYSLWKRSSNKNLNGLESQYILKSSDFSDYADEQIKEIEIK